MELVQYNPSTLKLIFTGTTKKAQIAKEGPSPGGCAYCTTTPSALDITLTGIDGNNCPCVPFGLLWHWVGFLQNINGTWRVPQQSTCVYYEMFNRTPGYFGYWRDYRNEEGCEGPYVQYDFDCLEFYIALQDTYMEVRIILYDTHDQKRIIIGKECTDPLTDPVTFNYDSGEDCGVVSTTNFTNVCAPSWVSASSCVAQGGTFASEPVYT